MGLLTLDAGAAQQPPSDDEDGPDSPSDSMGFNPPIGCFESSSDPYNAPGYGGRNAGSCNPK